jgi:hypothetical protein
MKEETRRRLSELILEELAERIRHDDSLREKLEPYTDLPVEKVAETVLKHLDLLLTEEFNETLHVDLKETLAEEEAVIPAEPEREDPPVSAAPEEPVFEEPAAAPETRREPASVGAGEGSIMKHFSLKESHPVEPFSLQLKADDWFYLYGLSYAPDSTGQGVPAKMLVQQGIEHSSNIFLVDSGDLRLYVSRLSAKEYSIDSSSRPNLASHQESRLKLEHENILNFLRIDESLIVLPHWTIYQGLQDILAKVEEKYVDLLKSLVELQDAADWDLELFAFDHHILQLPSITAGSKSRATPKREVKHPVGGRKSDVMIDKVIFREKSIAQDIHNQFLLSASKTKVDYMIRLDTAFMDDWKTILSARYAVSRDKRKAFWQTVKAVQEQYGEYELMMKIRTKADQFTF